MTYKRENLDKPNPLISSINYNKNFFLAFIFRPKKSRLFRYFFITLVLNSGLKAYTLYWKEKQNLKGLINVYVRL